MDRRCLLPKYFALSTSFNLKVPGLARWRAALQSAQTLLQPVNTEMSDYYAARSETWQESERGEAFRERPEALEALVSELETLAL